MKGLAKNETVQRWICHTNSVLFVSARDFVSLAVAYNAEINPHLSLLQAAGHWELTALAPVVQMHDRQEQVVRAASQKFRCLLGLT